MSKPKLIENLHYLGVKIERTLWNKLRLHADTTQDSVGKLVRNILTNWVKIQEEKIK